MKKLSALSLVVILAVLILAACGSGNTQSETDNGNNSENEEETAELGQQELSMPYVAWANTEASVHVVKPILEEIGYTIDLKQVEAGALFSGIANGSADFSAGAVALPHTHKDYWDKYEDKVLDIGVTMKDTNTLGLTVPSYMDIDSIEDLQNNKNDIGDKVDWNIVGIDPGSGIMDITQNDVMPGYDLEDDWDLQSSSGSAMTAELKKSINREEPVIVTLWEPHWAMLEWDLKYLKDPKNEYGDPDSVHAIARKGFKEDAPAAYEFLSQFQWGVDEIGEVMTMIHDGMDPEDAGKKWVKDHQDKVEEWTEGLK